MARIHIDGRQFEVAEGDNLLHACLTLGFDVPYFCWHPAMGSVGACRQCAVKQFKDEADDRGRIVMACLTPVIDGMRISIDNAEARRFRASVIEWLMLNHPHDCPVCDEGGECHLQDMTVMTGHTRRETRFAKRTHNNQDLGPLVEHEMNRCIQCYRCVRFYRDHAGGRDLDVFGAHDHVYFGRATDGTLESEFAGNLVEVCPTGVFTDKTFAEHYTRKWDLETAPSVCTHCSIGCNTILGAHSGELRRVRNRYHPDINGYFLCDRGRYGYEFANDRTRLLVPTVDGEVASPQAALEHAATLLAEAKGVIGIGSPRASLETLFALRTLLGDETLCAGVDASEVGVMRASIEALRDATPTASLRDVRAADAVLLLGEDPTATAPMLALAIRASVRVKPHAEAQEAGIAEWHDAAVRIRAGGQTGPLFVASSGPTRLDDVTTERVSAAPADVARFGYAVAAELGAPVPAEHVSRNARDAARRAAHALLAASRPVVVASAGSGEPSMIAAAAAVAGQLRERGVDARLCVTALEGNTIGAALLGAGSLEEALEALRSGAADTLVIAENDLFRRAGTDVVEELLGSARAVIALDALRTPTTARANVAFPAATPAEGTGTLVNHEGRAQRFFAVMPKPSDVRESWRWLAALADAGARTAFGRPGVSAPQWADEDDVLAAMAEALPEFAALRDVAPGAAWRSSDGRPIARETPRRSGRTAQHAETDVREHALPEDPDSALTFGMEGFSGEVPSALTPRYWAPGWNSVQALNKFQQEVGGELVGGSPGVQLIAPSGAADGAAVAGGGDGAGNATAADSGTGRLAASAASPAVPAAFEPRAGQWLLVPAYHAFGSEELSAHAPAIASLAPQPYLALAPADARAAGFQAGDAIRVETAHGSGVLELTITDGLASGIAALPVGVHGVAQSLRPGQWATLQSAAEEVRP